MFDIVSVVGTVVMSVAIIRYRKEVIAEYLAMKEEA